ncbi:hypothetical protein L1987_24298 [Smallanthus sonchifolius]|uniref:Uncharacterized protein n=1 Tax=Smallanthus sonchifolius TaxID=185202 RepID=A0ACB9IK06_9ASTR|nr:hypothetical protein L1987_24298 [Smallanthus sonchifolius]
MRETTTSSSASSFPFRIRCSSRQEVIEHLKAKVGCDTKHPLLDEFVPEKLPDSDRKKVKDSHHEENIRVSRYVFLKEMRLFMMILVQDIVLQASTLA